jgi:D-glycero-D-manno-heptose 1,7-bisphosphate phosphatase
MQPFVDPGTSAILARDGRPRRCLFLDRDGVINLDIGYVHTAGQTQWLPGIFTLVGDALKDGYVAVVVTNQAGIARGYYSQQQFQAFTRWVHDEFRARGVPLLATYHCPHHPDGIGELAVRCQCRKPAPGMFLQAIADWQIDASDSVVIGDKISDLQAARDAGLRRGMLLGSQCLPQWKDLVGSSLPEMEPAR